MAGAKLVLHDVRDARAFVGRIVAKSRLELSWHDRDDLEAFLLAEAWKLGLIYEPGRGAVSFSTFATTTLRKRLVDFERQRKGRTVWKFADRVHVRSLPELVSLDELDPLGDSDAGSSGDSTATGFASLGGLVATGGGQTDQDIRLIRRLVS